MTRSPVSPRPEVEVKPLGAKSMCIVMINGRRHLWISDKTRAYFAKPSE